MFSIIQVTKMHHLSYIILEQNIETYVVACRAQGLVLCLGGINDLSFAPSFGPPPSIIFME